VTPEKIWEIITNGKKSPFFVVNECRLCGHHVLLQIIGEKPGRHVYAKQQLLANLIQL